MDGEKQANDFLKETGAEIKIRFLKNDVYFPEDTQTRDIYKFTISRGLSKYSGKFGASLKDTEERNTPNAYDILSCLTKYEPESLDEFAEVYGYTKPSVATRIHKAVKKEYEGLKNIFTDREMEKMADIF